MKKVFCFLMALVMTAAVFCAVPFTESPFKITAKAASSGACGDNLTWTLDDNGTLTISGTGDMTDFSFSAIPWLSAKNDIKKVIIGNGVTNICDDAFYFCTEITSITLPDSITTIGNSAFCGCYNLTSITIPRNVTSIGTFAFAYCQSLASITIPRSITCIDSYTFSNCCSLTSITIPNNVTRIGWSAFENCDSLTSITIPYSVTSIYSGAFVSCDNLTAIKVSSSNTSYTSINGVLFNKSKTELIQYPAGKTTKTYTIPNSVTTISQSAFQASANLTSITIPDSVTNIEIAAFYDCTSLTSVTLPDSVTSIGTFAFSYCQSLASIRIPRSITCIDSYTFSDCCSLTSITIPNNVTCIGWSAFENCDSLTSITIPYSVTSIYSGAFVSCDNLTAIKVSSSNTSYTSIDGVLFNKSKTALIQYPAGKTRKTYTIPNGVTMILESAFEASANLTSITIPDSVTNIEIAAFYDCTSLTSVTIPDSITSIGDYAFCDCTSLADVYFSGTNNNWSSIEVGLWNGDLTSARIHYNVDSDDVSNHYVSTVTKNPTCTTDGEGVDVCSCGYSANEIIISAIGHDYSSSWTIDTPATCTTKGSKSHHCTRCDAKTDVTTIAIDSSNHNYSTSWTIDKVATCTTRGSKSHHCTRCDAKTDVTTIAIDNSNHNYSTSWTIDSPATCTTKGSKSHHCTRCDAKTDITAIAIDSSNHNYSSSWTIDVKPTCQSEGSKSHHCTRCDAKTNITVVKPTPHQFSDWEIIKEATYTSYGQKVSTCDVCHSTEYAVIPKLICAEPKLSKATNENSGVKITWTKVTGAIGYKVYRKTTYGKWSLIGNNVKSTSYIDKTAKSGISYKYTVCAYSAGGSSEYNENGLPIRRLITPSLKSAASTKSGVSLKWSKVTGATGYIIYRKTGSGSYSKLKTEKGVSNLSYVDKSAKKGKKYTYKVRAYYSNTSYSAYSGGKSVTDKY